MGRGHILRGTVEHGLQTLGTLRDDVVGTIEGVAVVKDELDVGQVLENTVVAWLRGTRGSRQLELLGRVGRQQLSLYGAEIHRSGDKVEVVGDVERHRVDGSIEGECVFLFSKSF